MIYILEDDDGIRELVGYALGKEGYGIEGFDNPQSFSDRVSSETPDLVILDIMLPQKDGLTVLSELRSNKKTKDLPVIMLTAKSDEMEKVRAFELGADDYVTKPFGIMELISRVKALLRRVKGRGSDDCGEVYCINGLCLDVSKHTVSCDGREISLALKEYDLLLELFRAGGNVLTREVLFGKIWGYEFDGTSRTLDVHIRKLRAKLGRCDNAVETVKGVGYKLGRGYIEPLNIELTRK